MSPLLATRQVAMITGLDLLAFDVIGYDPAPVPEPGVTGLLVFGLVALSLRRSKPNNVVR